MFWIQQILFTWTVSFFSWCLQKELWNTITTNIQKWKSDLCWSSLRNTDIKLTSSLKKLYAQCIILQLFFLLSFELQTEMRRFHSEKKNISSWINFILDLYFVSVMFSIFFSSSSSKSSQTLLYRFFCCCCWFDSFLISQTCVSYLPTISIVVVRRRLLSNSFSFSFVSCALLQFFFCFLYIVLLGNFRTVMTRSKTHSPNDHSYIKVFFFNPGPLFFGAPKKKKTFFLFFFWFHWIGERHQNNRQ